MVQQSTIHLVDEIRDLAQDFADQPVFDDVMLRRMIRLVSYVGDDGLDYVHTPQAAIQYCLAVAQRDSDKASARAERFRQRAKWLQANIGAYPDFIRPLDFQIVIDPTAGQALGIDEIIRLIKLRDIWAEENAFDAYVKATNARLESVENAVAELKANPSGLSVVESNSTYFAGQGTTALPLTFSDALIRKIATYDSLDDKIATANGKITENETNIATEKARITENETNIANNKKAINENKTNIETNKTNIETIGDTVQVLQGTITISPNSVPSVEALEQDFTTYHKDLPVAWLNGKGVNRVDIWLDNFGIHSTPWAPSADGKIDCNVNETELNSIGVGTDKAVSVRYVFYKGSDYVAEKYATSWLQIRELASVDAPTLKQFNDAIAAQNAARANLVTRSDAGDAIQPETITGAARFVSFLADQERSANAAVARFTVAVAEDYKGVRHNYKVNDYAWFPPRSVDGKVFANIPPPTEQFKLSTDLKVQLLTFHVEPGVIAYPSGGLQTALTTTVKVSIDNPDVLDDEIWVQGTIDGSPVLARRKWTTATGLLNFVIPQNIAGNIGQNEELDIVLQFYNAANAGNLVRQRRIGLPLVEQTAIVELANKAAYDAIAQKNANTIYLFN